MSKDNENDLVPAGFDFEFDYAFEPDDLHALWQEAEVTNKFTLPKSYQEIMSGFGVISGGYERGRLLQINEQQVCGIYLFLPMSEQVEDLEKPLSAIIQEHKQLLSTSTAPKAVPFAYANFYPDVGTEMIDLDGDDEPESLDALLVFDRDKVRLITEDGNWDLQVATDFLDLIQKLSDYGEQSDEYDEDDDDE
jgi:hypothetical protein